VSPGNLVPPIKPPYEKQAQPPILLNRALSLDNGDLHSKKVVLIDSKKSEGKNPAIIYEC